MRVGRAGRRELVRRAAQRRLATDNSQLGVPEFGRFWHRDFRGVALVVSAVRCSPSPSGAIAMLYTRIEVVISGAVERSGRTRLEPGATVDTALRAAGGLAYRTDVVPAGELILRRRVPTTRSVSVYRWCIFGGESSSWRSFPLEQHDVLVFEWSLHRDGA